MLGQTRACLNCGKKFQKSRRVHRFCCQDCRFEHWQRTHPRVSIERTETGNVIRIELEEAGARSVERK